MVRSGDQEYGHEVTTASPTNHNNMDEDEESFEWRDEATPPVTPPRKVRWKHVAKKRTNDNNTKSPPPRPRKKKQKENEIEPNIGSQGI